VGGRKVEHLIDNIQALKTKLTDVQIEYLESIKPLDVGSLTALSAKAHLFQANLRPPWLPRLLTLVQARKAIGRE